MRLIVGILFLAVGIVIGNISHEQNLIPGLSSSIGLSIDAGNDGFPLYEKSDYIGDDWDDLDDDCQDSRTEMMIAYGLDVVLDDAECKIVSGEWTDEFTGNTISNPGDVVLLHVIPLSEAHYSGAYKWDAKQKTEFANGLARAEGLFFDPKVPLPSNLIITAGSDRAEQSITDWQPQDRRARCRYYERWITLKGLWQLDTTEPERAFLDKQLRSCL